MSSAGTRSRTDTAADHRPVVAQVQAATDDQHQVAEHEAALFMIIEGVREFLTREQFQDFGQRLSVFPAWY